MDGLGVDLKVLMLLQSEQKKKGIQELLDIDTCRLQTIHSALKTRTGGLYLGDKTLKAAYTILRDSPARRDDYQAFTKQA